MFATLKFQTLIMKKVLFSIFLGASFAAMAQPDLEVTLTAPANNGTITAGTQFNFDVTFTNKGTVAIDAQDSIIFAPVINGSLLGSSGGGSVVYLEQQAIPVGGSISVTRPLQISGGSSGSWNFCAFAVVTGNGWSGVTESDTINNEDCITLTYDAGSNIGMSELTFTQAVDDSYYANGTYFVRMENQVLTNTPSLVVYNLAGVKVFSTSLQNDNTTINQDVVIEGLTSGVYLVEVQGLANRVVRKIVIE